MRFRSRRENNTTILKFFLYISPEEQLRAVRHASPCATFLRNAPVNADNTGMDEKHGRYRFSFSLSASWSTTSR